MYQKIIILLTVVLILCLNTVYAAETKGHWVTATLNDFSCGDYCHLGYKDLNGEIKNGICEADICGPDGAFGGFGNENQFKKYVGQKVRLRIERKYLPEGGTYEDWIMDIKFKW